MSEVRFGDVVRVAPRPGMRCVIPATGTARAIEVPPEGIEVTADLMVLRLLHHQDLVVVPAAQAAILEPVPPAKAAAAVKEQK